MDRLILLWSRVSSAGATWTSLASSSWVGARPRSLVRRLPACSIVRATVLTERGAQSAARTASRMAPRMRWAAKRLNGTPRASS
jgi:hypothetical protein